MILLTETRAFAKMRVISFVGKKREEKVIEFENFEVFRFTGNRQPIKGLELSAISKNALFIPLASNYPGYDFIYFDKSAKIVYFIQVTIRKNAFSHITHNDSNDGTKEAIQV